MEDGRASLQRRRYMITENNPFGEGDTQPLEDTVKGHFRDLLEHDHFRFLAGQYEQGTNGTYHLQMYVEFTNRMRWRAVKEIVPRADIRPAMGSQVECLAYVVKQDSRICGPWTWGKPAKQGERTDIIMYTDAIKSGRTDYEILEEFPRELCKYPHHLQRVRSIMYRVRAHELYEQGVMRSAVVLYGEAGSGKTRWVLDRYGAENVYMLSFGTGTKGSVWFDEYRGEKVLLLDDFYGQVKFDFLLRLLDRYPIRVQVKGGTTYLCVERVYITSNSKETYWYSTVPEMSRRALHRRITGSFLIPEEGEDLEAHETYRKMREEARRLNTDDD
jgi:hypothetical protein